MEHDESLVRGRDGRLFLGLGAAAIAINLGRMALPPLLPAIIDDLAISATAAGLALTVLWVTYAVCQYPAGLLADRSRRAALVVGLLSIGVGYLLLAGTAAYSILLVAAAIVGIGTALFMIANRVVLSDRYVARRGVAFGWNIAAGHLGSIAAAGLAVAALTFASWQLTFLPLVPIVGLLAVVVHRLSTGPYMVRRPTINVRDTATRVFASQEIRLVLIAYTIVIFAWQGVTAFLPVFLQAERGFTPSLAGGGFATVFAVGLVIQPLAGWMSDRASRTLVGALAALLAAVGLGGLLYTPSTVGVMVAIVVFAIGLTAFPPVMQAHVMDVLPAETRGSDLGAFKTIYEGVAGLGPTYVGAVAATMSYAAAFSGLVAALVLAVGLLVAGPRWQ